MKKLSFKSFWGVTLLVLAVLIVGSISSKTFAFNATTYISNYTPEGCTTMTVTGRNTLNFTGGPLLANTIYVLSAGTYTITSNIVMNNCSVLINDSDTLGKTTLHFQGDRFIIAENKQNFTIRGINTSNKLGLINNSNSTLAIIFENTTGANVSYTTISGFNNGGCGILFNNTKGSTISGNIITNNFDGINIQGLSFNNKISDNTIQYNTNNGIFVESSASGQRITNNRINHNTSNGIFINSSYNTISNNTGLQNGDYGIKIYNARFNTGFKNYISGSAGGIYLYVATNNTLLDNTIEHNFIGLELNDSDTNEFLSNNIVSNEDGLSMDTSSGNIFNGGSISSNTQKNIYFVNSDYNRFSTTTIQSSAVGIHLQQGSDYNLFTGINLINNTQGFILKNSSNNTINLDNNNNGILLDLGSDNNNIYNNQSTNNPINNITISSGINNIITGGLFTTPSTPSTSVNIKLKNDQSGIKSYTIIGTDLSGTYAGTMTLSTETVAIEFSGANGLKDIIVTYTGNNKQYDSIILNKATGTSGGPGGPGGPIIPMCTSSQLVCSSGTRVLASGAICQSANLGKSCGLSGSKPIGSIVGSPFSPELNNAYLRAFGNGITTMNTIQKANMTGSLIRSHMAKMISNFAMSLGGSTPNTGATCNFSDIANQSAEMKYYIQLACQLGLMGQNISKFDPSSVVTRAQFGTILSRVIRGNKYEGGAKYYTNHLAALKNVGIMTKIEHPTEKEIRGYVMIMMKRTYDGGFLNK